MDAKKFVDLVSTPTFAGFVIYNPPYIVG